MSRISLKQYENIKWCIVMEDSKKKSTANRTLTIFFAVMIIPFLMISIWSLDHIRRESINVFNGNLTRFTHNTSMESIHRQLEEIEVVLQILDGRITNEDIQSFFNEEKGVIHSTISSVVNTLTFFNAAIISDTNDNYRSYPDPEVKEIDFIPSKSPWFPRGKNQKGIHYSEPYVEETMNARTIKVSMNLFNDELQRYGNISFDLDMHAMSSALKNVVVPFQGTFLVASKDGGVIMSENVKDIFIHTIPLKWIEKSVNLEGYFYDEENDKHIFYRSFSDPNWIAFTIVDHEMYKEHINKAPQDLISIIAVSLIIYIILLCLCRVYLREIISRLYMGVNGISYEGQVQDLEGIYSNIKNSHDELIEVRRISAEDALTGIGTRRKFDERMAEFINNDTLFYLAILDLDNFKKINDMFGHAVGDSVLQYVSKVGKSLIEPDYDIYRYGGEELVVLFQGEEFSVYFELLQTWRRTICQRQWREKALNVSFSGGIARRKKGECAQDIITKADAALYEAKNSGKNAIHTAKD